MQDNFDKDGVEIKDRDKEEDTSRHKVTYDGYLDPMAHPKAWVNAGYPSGADAVIHRGNQQPNS